MTNKGSVLSGVSHGGHVLDKPAPSGSDGMKPSTPTVAAGGVGEVTFTTPFDYLFPAKATDPASLLDATNPAKVVAQLKALGDAMAEAEPIANDLQAGGNSIVPPVYTYWGQFIDHDLTANTDRDSAVSDITRVDLKPLAPAFVTENLKNLRQPAVNLDNLYGDGPTWDPKNPTKAGSFFDGALFKIGTVAEVSAIDGTPIPGAHIPPVADLRRDLPRIDSTAQIADARNDENLIVAQLHTSFLRFHNNVVEALRADDRYAGSDERAIFERAQQLTRWHHQWLVVNDYLKTVTLPGMTDKVLLGGLKFYRPSKEPFMPLEYSVAAFRFGHTMVRGAYDYNRNFGRTVPNQVEPQTLPTATFDLLFTFTGKARAPFFGVTKELPFNWIIEWDRFVSKTSPDPTHFARKIDTLLAPPLTTLLNEGSNPATPEIGVILKHLARRNLLRGYLLSLPTGQAAANATGVTPLTADELQQNNTASLNAALQAGGFLKRTPLWFYLLKEAEVRANGNSLGELGSRIVCETIVGQLQLDKESYFHHPGGWHPGQGVRLSNGDPIVTIGDFLRFAGTL